MSESSRTGWAGRGFALALATGYAQLGVAVAIQLLLVPLYVRYLGPYRFGVFMMILSFTNFAAVGIGWMSGSALRAYGMAYARGDEQGFSRVFAVAKWTYLGYAMIVVALGGAIVQLPGGALDSVPTDHRSDVTWGMVASAVYLLLHYALSADRLALSGRGDQATANLMLMGSQLFYAVFAWPILHYGGGVAELMAALAVGVVITQMASGLILRRRGLRLTSLVSPSREHAPVFRQLVGREARGYLGFGMLTLMLQADVLLLGWLGGPDLAGQFVLVWRMPEVALLMLSKVSEALAPFLIHSEARGEVSSQAKAYRRILALVAVLALVGGVGFALVGQVAVGIWVGAGHAPTSAEAYALAGGALFLMALSKVPQNFAYANAKLRGINILMIVEVAARVFAVMVSLGFLGYAAPLAAACGIHAAGLAIGYQIIGWRICGRGPSGSGKTVSGHSAQ